MVTGNEKWVTYKNFNRTISWSNYGRPFIPHKTQFTSEEGCFMHLVTQEGSLLAVTGKLDITLRNTFHN